MQQNKVLPNDWNLRCKWKTSASARQPMRLPSTSGSPGETHGWSWPTLVVAQEGPLPFLRTYVSHKHHGHTPEEGFGVSGQEASSATHIRWSHVIMQNTVHFEQLNVSHLRRHRCWIWSNAGSYIISPAAQPPTLWHRLQHCYDPFQSSWWINKMKHP